MKEIDALRKWCPFVRVTMVNDHGPVNREQWFYRNQVPNVPQSSMDARTCCIGTMCMAWHDTSPDHTEGYCGLVGGRALPL